MTKESSRSVLHVPTLRHYRITVTLNTQHNVQYVFSSGIISSMMRSVSPLTDPGTGTRPHSETGLIHSLVHEQTLNRPPSHCDPFETWPGTCPPDIGRLRVSVPPALSRLMKQQPAPVGTSLLARVLAATHLWSSSRGLGGSQRSHMASVPRVKMNRVSVWSSFVTWD